MKMFRKSLRAAFAPLLLAGISLAASPRTCGAADQPAVPYLNEVLAPRNPATEAAHPFFWPESALNPEQRARYRAAVETNRVQMQKIDAQIRALSQERDEAILAEHMDEAVVRNKGVAIAQLEGEKALLRARALASIRASLSPEQVELLKKGESGPRPRVTPEQMEVRRQEMKTDLEKRVAEEHEAKRQQLGAKVEAEIAELRKKQAAGSISTEEKERLERLERMKVRIKSGGE